MRGRSSEVRSNETLCIEVLRCGGATERDADGKTTYRGTRCNHQVVVVVTRYSFARYAQALSDGSPAILDVTEDPSVRQRHRGPVGSPLLVVGLLLETIGTALDRSERHDVSFLQGQALRPPLLISR